MEQYDFFINYFKLYFYYYYLGLGHSLLESCKTGDYDAAHEILEQENIRIIFQSKEDTDEVPKEAEEAITHVNREKRLSISENAKMFYKFLLSINSRPEYSKDKFLVDFKDSDGKTPLHIAVENSPNIISLLLDYGANVGI